MNLKNILKVKEKRIYACQKSILLFSLYYFTKYHTFKIPQFHKEFYKDLEFKNTIGAIWITFRESAKTSLAKIKIIHSIVYNYKHFIIWTSFDQSKAKANLFDVALELQTNKRLIADFGQLFFGNKDEKKSEKKSIGEFITENNIKVKAYSTGQTPRGEVHGEFRPDLIVLDDIETMTTAESEAKTEQVKKYIDELLSGLANTANVLILANRIIFGGTINYLEDRLKDDNDFVIRDIAVIQNGEIVWKDKYVHTDQEAQELNENIEDKRKHKVSLETKKRLLGHQVYNREMLNTPITDEEREFKKDWFKERPRADIERMNTRRFLTIDTAMSEKESADFTGFCENYIDSENFWNLAAYKMKLNPKDLVDYLFTLHSKRSFEKIGIEKTTFTEGLKPYLEEEMRKRNSFLPIVELSHGGTKKETRIRGLIPRYSSKSVFHIIGECKDLEEELYNFPKSLHDDVSDATAYQLQISEGGNNQFTQVMDSNESSYIENPYE